MIKLVASDLDGTIVSDNEYIHKSNFEAISMMNTKAVNFAICTGKSYSVSKDLCNKCNADYGIFNNGSQIYDLTTGEKLYSKRKRNARGEKNFLLGGKFLGSSSFFAHCVL